jgi:hypothetical protein
VVDLVVGSGVVVVVMVLVVDDDSGLIAVVGCIG